MAERIQMVSDYMRSFQDALENKISLEEAGGTQRQYLAGEYIKKNKRDIVLFVTTGPPETSRHVIEITYKMPVGEEPAEAIFNEDGIMPSEGPTFFDYDVAEGTAIATIQENAQKPSRGLASWPAEKARIEGALVDMPAEKKRVARNILRYWRDMRTRIYDAVYAADVRIRRTTSDRTASSSSVRAATSSRSTTASNPQSQRRTTGRSTTASDPRPPKLSSRKRRSSKSSSRRTSSRKTSSD
jgi:hypothetical protein